jgi:LPXTG-motif cell wall-anchored protein
MTTNGFGKVCSLAGLLYLTVAGHAQAARPLLVTVEVDKHVVLQTIYTDQMHRYGFKERYPEPAEVWRYLGRPGQYTKSTVQADPTDPLRANLKGDIVLRISHADDLLAQAKLAGLALQRDRDTNSDWHLSAVEVERTAHEAGLPALIVPHGLLEDPVMWLVLIGAGVLVAMAILFFRRRRRLALRPNEQPRAS